MPKQSWNIELQANVICIHHTGALGCFMQIDVESFVYVQDSILTHGIVS